MVWPILNQAQNKALKEIVQSQNHRVAAILGGAMLDDSLRQTIELRLRPFDPSLRPALNVNDRLFEVAGPLGNTAPKIDLAYQLYMIDEVTYHAMHGLTKIRNMFAHNLEMSFDDDSKEFNKAFRKLKLHEGRTHYPAVKYDGDTQFKLDDTSTRRGIWTVNLQLAQACLMSDQDKHQMWSNVPTNIRSLPPVGLLET